MVMIQHALKQKKEEETIMYMPFYKKDLEAVEEKKSQ